MRKILFPAQCLVLLVSLSVFISCQKEVEGKLPDAPAVSSKNPEKLSAAIKVWHGTRTIGTMPAATGNNPAIDPTTNPSVLAIAGRYAIIKPEVTSGEIAGYYVGIPGAGQYFKVDFTKPRIIAGRNQFIKKKGLFQTESFADSSIVIVIPPTINIPDTFCVTYYPYDPFGNIGQPVTTCIYVSAIGAGPNADWLKNDFKLTASWDVVNGVRTNLDTVIFNRFANSNSGYYCNQSLTPPGLTYWYPQITDPVVVSDSIKYIKNNFRLAITGAFDYTDIEESKSVDVILSNCSQFVFRPIYVYTDTVIGAYHFNEATQRLILVYEFDELGVPVAEYYEYQLIKINDRHFILKDLVDDYFIRFER